MRDLKDREVTLEQEDLRDQQDRRANRASREQEVEMSALKAKSFGKMTGAVMRKWTSNLSQLAREWVNPLNSQFRRDQRAAVKHSFNADTFQLAQLTDIGMDGTRSDEDNNFDA